MKSLTFIGFILLILSSVLFYLTTDFSLNKFTLSHTMGIMGGVGIGLIIGGLVGYVSKGSAMKEAQRKKEIVQLRKEKEDLERQAADLANQTITMADKNKADHLTRP